MYKVSRVKHDQYGRVIEITRSDSDEYITPYDAVHRAQAMYRLWQEEESGKIRVLVDSQIMTIRQAESWANQEYRALPKCEECAKILNGQVFSHSLSETFLFCSQRCADNNFNYILSQRDEETECDL